MIPTREKKPLPKGYSYPLGAQKISSALGELPQEGAISFCFEWRDEFWVSKWQKRISENGTVKLISAEYASRWDEWWVYVYSVPSTHSTTARELLLKSALSKLGDQLREAGRRPSYFKESIVYNLAKYDVA